MTLSISLALIAGLLWAISNVIDKTVLSKYVKNPFVVMPVIGLMGLVVGTIIVLSNYQSLPTEAFWRLVFFSAVNFVSIVFYFFALKNEEVSRMVPLYGTTPVFMIFIELIAFGTRLNVLQYGGVAAVVVGAIVLSLRPGPAKFNKKGLLLILISSLAWAFAIVYLTDVFNNYGYWLGWGWLQVTIGVLGLLSLLFLKKEFFSTIKEKGKKVLFLIAGSQLFAMTAGAMLFYAAMLWFASLASSVSSDQFVLTFIFSLIISHRLPHLYKEEVNRKIIIQKTISILLIIAGIFLISI